MTIYVVTTGDYSDYGVEAMFSTKEKAQAFIDTVKHGDANPIEEYELDAYSDAIGRGLYPWIIIMDKQGRVRHAAKATFELDARCELTCYFPRTEDSIVELHCTCWAKDEQHAVKIANEKRAQIIAMNLWREVAQMSKVMAAIKVEV